MASTYNESILVSPRGKLPIWSTFLEYVSLLQRKGLPLAFWPTGTIHFLFNVSIEAHGSLTEPQLCQPTWASKLPVLRLVSQVPVATVRRVALMPTACNCSTKT